ncbi:unnamed protein product [Parnassius mnemosyne]|uniref:Peptidoglycan recognition protein family domain-containing protein n=1 Tax=Parnassius mnemosyne TaxID=213953 RepID=A0AAV1L3E9_9NEOP
MPFPVYVRNIVKNSSRAEKLCCLVALPVLITCVTLIVLFAVQANNNPEALHSVTVGLKEPWYLRRGDWHAMSPHRIEFLELPVSYVIIGHAASHYCNQLYPCIEQMLLIQEAFMRRGMNDIGPNFLVGGNGYVFEGRGANVLGAMVTSWNKKSITIMFMGNYVVDMPDQAQFDHINVLLDVLVKERVLRSNYTLYAQCQVKPHTYAPGRHITERMKNFPHWNPVNISGCLI